MKKKFITLMSIITLFFLEIDYLKSITFLVDSFNQISCNLTQRIHEPDHCIIFVNIIDTVLEYQDSALSPAHSTEREKLFRELERVAQRVFSWSRQHNQSGAASNLSQELLAQKLNTEELFLKARKQAQRKVSEPKLPDLLENLQYKGFTLIPVCFCDQKNNYLCEIKNKIISELHEIQSFFSRLIINIPHNNKNKNKNKSEDDHKLEYHQHTQDMQQKLEKNSDFFIQEEKVLFLTRESLEKIIEQLLIDHLNNIKTICCIDTDQERLTLLQLFMASEIRQKYPYTGFWLQKKAEEPWHYEQAHYQFLQLILTQQWPTHKKNSLLKNKKNTLAVSTKSKENKRKEKSLKLA